MCPAPQNKQRQIQGSFTTFRMTTEEMRIGDACGREMLLANDFDEDAVGEGGSAE
jgi:hypothetical protein